ncbi:MAG TPA: 3',5'-cyclic-nucleotide phosphodiesterase [Cyclobacteriaceae bacterium]|nr:3',5'-cyclic-nucleotide phosphodiesterase [Cyclobacteriaceae bacterium]HMV10099.1 3',5'-cyclic-nucleotide phosphodiesterase [Cyclobacteriaceae bacterium]HMV88652.1 3',5'-cyclic-nucleotide phosphodiesterase [Cyclobacteriaceae bacterium]HMX00586.1 3',5'-cyclic-nucleotide phosphodiesterase [Cyclobacteriaceae bacterium]HMX49539.1 3',5'-cyclic-nucleotide phosphodiesterase [Cyclobacteriaceae bacterium]
MKRLLFFLLVITTACRAQSSFTVIPLGVKGGTDESNLSSYAVAAKGSNNYVCLDAGTLHAGIQKSIENKTLQGDATSWLRKNVKGYLISHPHFDHVAGLIMNAPEDSSKYIYGIESCLSVLKEKHFSWKSWANFANEGEKPTLNKYTYQTLIPATETPLTNTSLYATPFVLSHVSPNESTAFLVRNGANYILYLGDTGSDRIEKSDNLNQLWKAIGPLIRDKKLKAIFIEVSFDNLQPENLLFGHLTPRLLTEELNALSNYCGKDALKNFPIAITHMKPYKDREQKIKKQLDELNVLGVKFVFPQQGKVIEF